MTDYSSSKKERGLSKQHRLWLVCCRHSPGRRAGKEERSESCETFRGLLPPLQHNSPRKIRKNGPLNASSGKSVLISTGFRESGNTAIAGKLRVNQTQGKWEFSDMNFLLFAGKC